MTIVQSVRSVVWKYFVLRGRAGRPEFWWWALAYMTAIIVAGRIDLQFDDVLFSRIEGMPPFPIATFVFLALLPAHIAVSARRLHDVGCSAWLLAIGVIPVVGALVLLWHFIKPSVEAVNRHGRPPPGITYY